MWPVWARRLPVIRTYEALREAQGRLAEVKDELKRTRDRSRRLAAHPVSRGRLKDIVGDHAQAYRTADPYPHVVLDGLFDPELLTEALVEFESMDRSTWHHTVRETERKYSTEDFLHMGPVCRQILSQLNAAPFLEFLGQLTGIEGLIADPHLRGGGLHEICRDGALGVHADFNFYPRLGLYRRLNVLVYLNKDWAEAWGGHLELWDRGGKACVTRIAPVFNRTVIFDTSNFSYHGHPAPLACPPERSRKSLALYYYTVEAPAEQDRTPHTTIFLETSAPAVAVAPPTASVE